MKISFNIKQSYKPLIALGVIIAVLLVLDFNYLWYNLAQIFKGRTQTIQILSIPSGGQKMEPDTLIIPSLGIKTPVVYAQEANEKVFQAALINGVAHYPGTASPGESGNIYIFGHSSDYIWSKGKYKTIFADLPKIKIGSEIWLSGVDGRAYLYIAKESFVAGAKDVEFLSQDTGGKKILTLQTSWPLGTALKRWIVKAELKTP